MIMSFVDSLRDEGFAVESICRVLTEQGCKIAARTYRAWRSAGPAKRTVSDARTVDAVRDTVWTTDDHGRRKLTPEGLYGRSKLTAHLRRLGHEVTPGSVDRAMKLLGHNGIRRCRKIRTTIPDPDGVRAEDLVDRDFTASEPNELWCTDFTYVRTWSGWVYVAFIVDVYSRLIVSWHAQTGREADLVTTPLRMALWWRRHQGHPVRAGRLIHHSEAGTQYTSTALTDDLALQKIWPSIGSVGDADDNALIESVNGLYKTECIHTTVFHAGPYKTLSDVEFATSAWVAWYNNDRLHSSIGMVPPAEFESTYYAALNRELHPV